MGIVVVGTSPGGGGGGVAVGSSAGSPLPPEAVKLKDIKQLDYAIIHRNLHNVVKRIVDRYTRKKGKEMIFKRWKRKSLVRYLELDIGPITRRYELVSPPLRITAILDTSGSMDEWTQVAIFHIIDFIRRQNVDDIDLMFINFASGGRILEFPVRGRKVKFFKGKDANTLRRIFQEFKDWASLVMERGITCPEEAFVIINNDPQALKFFHTSDVVVFFSDYEFNCKEITRGLEKQLYPKIQKMPMFVLIDVEKEFKPISNQNDSPELREWKNDLKRRIEEKVKRGSMLHDAFMKAIDRNLIVGIPQTTKKS